MYTAPVNAMFPRHLCSSVLAFFNVLMIKEERKRKARDAVGYECGGWVASPSAPRPLTHTIKKTDINYLLFCRQEAALLLKGVIYPPLELYVISNEQNCNEGDAVSCANTANTDKLKVIKSCCCLKRDNSHLCKSKGFHLQVVVVTPHFGTI